jgi:exopolysaccharide production protein ExoQ
MAFIKYQPQITTFLLFLMMSMLAVPFGALLVLADMALLGLLALTHRDVVLPMLVRWWPILTLPIVATLSGFWSDYAAVSFRYGAQFLFTGMIGLILARTMSLRHFVLAVMLAQFAYCVLCIIDGTQGPSQGGMVLIGYSGSKNMIATVGFILAMAALTALLMGKLSPLMRLASVASLAMGVFIVDQANSSGALVMAAVGALALIGIWLAQRLTTAVRTGAIIVALAVFTPLVLLAPEAGTALDRFMYETLNKDPTLSGREQLWARADALIAERPYLGYGYAAIWMGDSSETIALQRLTNVADMRSFNFHDHFRQTRVDMGLLGLLAFIGTVVAAGLASLRRLILKPSMEFAFFFVIFLATISRASMEVVLGAMATPTVLFYACCFYAFARLQEPVPAPSAPIAQPDLAQSWATRR